MTYKEAYLKSAREAKDDYFMLGIKRTEAEVIDNALRLIQN